MFAKISGGKLAATALLLLSLLVCAPIAFGQGHGGGHGRGGGHGGGRPSIVGLPNATPGIPESPRGRGRYSDPGIPRGRIYRSRIFRHTHHDNRNPFPGIPRRRRVRRHHHNH
ncbi:MAG: hypothetical protein AUG51_24215 [Acidobacteria bacterium 13_1_20CM_3_53_8]|nr:MAG: hypothetical protein AUG51_24215 [Acidobacteria bacterium 13_1_20CM_3_53_8]